MRSDALVFLALTAVFATGCTQFPALEDTVSEEARNAPYMTLEPVETLRAGVPGNRIEDTDTATMEARIARLRTRAARLSGSVVDSQTRSRMSRGVE
ncbi:hypothetical protein SAMN05444398_101848 [Roseovarius pacificus]|uniref:Uncharacterized protein n=1 Tax=Roseovarius pacificus TaxID=337701 RepID=A0A1M6YGD1_9RHOB|nr:hypothetical protein [Roseovarius pacificus]GGO50901.1 hypothetical protein GCM10011315_02770 [Roseovarius pacificus]SHL17278.1 hypothetical protein SAMN05444398_101848 [Roseovarius pacificus]